MYISSQITIPDDEIDIRAIRAQGAGGQNVNKVSSAIHLRFDIGSSSLPEEYKHRLRNLQDQRISRDGIIVIKAQTYRRQEKNREEAMDRLRSLILRAGQVRQARKLTKPTRNSRMRRMDSKTKRGKLKALRKNYDD